MSPYPPIQIYLFLPARIKLKNLCAYHEANDQTIVQSIENVQKSHLGPKLLAFEKSSPKSVFLG